MVFLRSSLILLVFSCTFCAEATNPQKQPDLAPRDGTTCPQGGNREVTAPKENIWASIPESERTALKTFIQPWADQNILRIAGSGVDVQYIDLVYPNKSDALAYLQDHGPEPSKYASFNLVFAEDEHSHTTQKFSIGPLPLSPNVTTIQPMNRDATSSTGGKIVQQVAAYVRANDMLKEIVPDMEDILEDLVGKNATARGASEIKWEPNVTWVRNFSWPNEYMLTLPKYGFSGVDPNNFDAGYLLPQGLFFKFGMAFFFLSSPRLVNYVSERCCISLSRIIR